MLERILVPTDFSKYSQRVLECVREFPGVKEVVVLHVIGPADPLARVWDPGGRIEEAKVKLAEQKKLLESRGINVKTRAEVLTEGEVSRLIEMVAEEEKISLIAMGARGKGVVEGILLGNVAKSILRYGNMNLLLMRYNILESSDGSALGRFCSQPFSKVLCPTDLSEPAEEAIALVKGIEGVREVVLLHVVFRGETWKEIEGHVEEATEKLNSIGGELERAGLKVKVQVSVGSPAEQIRDFASKEDVSLIAMSAYGKGWLKQLTVGSTTYDVARLADRPVMVVRTGLKA